MAVAKKAPAEEAAKAAAEAQSEAEDRIEVFEATRPDGSVVEVTRNIDTGEQSVRVISDSPAADDESDEA